MSPSIPAKRMELLPLSAPGMSSNLPLTPAMDDAFGKDKVTVDHTDGKLSFKTDSGSTLSLGGSAVEVCSPGCPSRPRSICRWS